MILIWFIKHSKTVYQVECEFFVKLECGNKIFWCYFAFLNWFKTKKNLWTMIHLDINFAAAKKCQRMMLKVSIFYNCSISNTDNFLIPTFSSIFTQPWDLLFLYMNWFTFWKIAFWCLTWSCTKMFEIFSLILFWHYAWHHRHLQQVAVAQ